MARTPDTRRGEVFRRWLRGLPRTTRRLVVAGLVIGVLALWYVVLLVGNAWLSDGSDWTEPLPSMIGGIAGMAVVLGLQRRRLGSFRRMGDYDTAVRRGRLPEDADPAEWGPLLEGEQRFQRGARTFALGVTVFAVVVVVFGFAWAGFGWIAVLVAALIGALGVGLLEVASRRQTARIESLRDQLRDLPDRGPLTPGD